MHQQANLTGVPSSARSGARSTSSTRQSDQINAAVTAADDQPLSQGAAQVGDHDHASSTLRGVHDSLPPLVPRLDGVVEVLDVVEVLFLGALSKDFVEQLRVRTLVGKGLGKSRQVGQVRAVAFPTPAALHATGNRTPI